MADVEYKKVLKAFYDDMGKFQKITKIYKKDKADLPSVTINENGDFEELYPIHISPKVNLIQDETIIIFIGVAGELYTLDNVYHIAYTLNTDNILTMFCFSDGKWKGKIICVDSEYKVVRNDFKYCIINELTMPPMDRKKKRKSFNKY